MLLIDDRSAKIGGGLTVKNALDSLTNCSDVSWVSDGRLGKLSPGVPLIRVSGRSGVLLLSETTACSVPAGRKIVLCQNVKPWSIGITNGSRREILRSRVALYNARSASKLVAISHHLADVVLAASGVKPEVIYPGIDHKVFHPPEGPVERNGPPTILVPSSGALHKGHLAAIAAIDSAFGCTEALDVLLAGAWFGDIYQARVELAISQSPRPERYRFLGSVSVTDLSRLYRKADLVLLPSELESFGLPLVEALACSAQVVARDIPAFRELADSRYVSFFTSEDDLVDLLRDRRTLDPVSVDLKKAHVTRAFPRELFCWSDFRNGLLRH